VVVTHVNGRVKRLPADPQPGDLDLLMETSAATSPAPTADLESLGVKRRRPLTPTLADGARILRGMGGACLEYKGVGGMAPLLFAPLKIRTCSGRRRRRPGGLMLAPLSRDLRQAPAMLAGVAVP